MSSNTIHSVFILSMLWGCGGGSNVGVAILGGPDGSSPEAGGASIDGSAGAAGFGGGDAGGAGGTGTGGNGGHSGVGGGQVQSCPSDAVSPNHSQEAAYLLKEGGTIDGLVVCAGQDDWFRLDLPMGYEMQFDACTKEQQQQAGIDFEFFREEYQSPDAYLGGGSESCQGTVTFEAPGTYWFHVFTNLSAVSYSAKIHLSPWQDWPCDEYSVPCDSVRVCGLGGRCICKTDSLEPNDIPADAKAVAADETYDLVACIADSDWYAFDATGSSMTIHLETHALLGHGYWINAAVFGVGDPASPLAFFAKVESSQYFPFVPPSPGTYLIRIQDVSAIGHNYKLRVTNDS